MAAAELGVDGLAVLGVGILDPALQLTAPGTLGPVVALISEPGPAPSFVEELLLRADAAVKRANLCPVDERADQVPDLDVRAILPAILHEALENA